MATLDTKKEAIVLRVVYDGSPDAGKTACVYALKNIFPKNTREVYINKMGKQHDRSEWLEYTGGTFQGRPIVCQIVTTPGRPSLRGQRRAILHSADVVVFVADSRASRLALSLEYLRETRDTLYEAHAEQPAPILLQANHRDAVDALQEELLDLLLPDQIRWMTSVASQNQGVRDAFVFAVSLAVARLRTRLDAGFELLQTTEHDPDHLFQHLQVTEDEAINDADSVLETILNPATLDTPEEAQLPHLIEATHDTKPTLPTPETAAHLVFPSQRGRAMLAQTQSLTDILRQQSDGSWDGCDRVSGWRAFSRADWYYATEDDALHALRQHVRVHVRYSPVLAEQRLVAAEQDSAGYWRIWQLAYAPETLSQALQSALSQENFNLFARDVYTCARRILRAHTLFSEYAPRLPVTFLDALSATEIPTYVGLLDVDIDNHAPSAVEVMGHVRDILLEPLAMTLAMNGFDAIEVLNQMRSVEPQDLATLELLAELMDAR